MNDIDEMNAMELKIAIAEALGWEHVGAGMWLPRLGATFLTYTCFLPDWPTDIAAAMTLDEDGWRWESEERYKAVEFPVVWVRCFTRTACHVGEARFDDILDKPAATAIARCRAYLKAKRAEAER